MRRAIGAKEQAARRPKRPFRVAASVALLCALAACGGNTTHHARYSPTHYYPPPGPPSDPWGPYIREASGRFSVPEQWIRKVMRQESGGQQDVISWAGAMGLMQVMPDTYNELRGRYGLGDDPFDPHNNILAGTAYLKEMYDLYGAPGFLAAYNAGPRRLDRYLNNGTPLPEETVQYVAAIAPQLGPGTVMTGPLAAYAGGRGYASRYAAARRTSGGCDPDAAYDPTRPCGTAAVAVAAFTPFVPGPPASTSGCDPDAALIRRARAGQPPYRPLQSQSPRRLSQDLRPPRRAAIRTPPMIHRAAANRHKSRLRSRRPRWSPKRWHRRLAHGSRPRLPRRRQAGISRLRPRDPAACAVRCRNR